MTTYHYILWLSEVFQFLELPGSNIEEQGQVFLDKAKHDQRCAQENIMQFLSYHKDGEVNKRDRFEHIGDIHCTTKNILWNERRELHQLKAYR